MFKWFTTGARGGARGVVVEGSSGLQREQGWRIVEASTIVVDASNGYQRVRSVEWLNLSIVLL